MRAAAERQRAVLPAALAAAPWLTWTGDRVGTRTTASSQPSTPGDARSAEREARQHAAHAAEVLVARLREARAG